MQLELELENYVNERCPAQCDEQHETPNQSLASWRWGFDAMFECPTTGTLYFYYGADQWTLIENPANWTECDYADDPIRYDGYWYRDHEDAGLFYCEGHDDYVPESRYGADGLCESCYRENEDYDDDNYGDGDSEAMPICAARECNSHDVTHYHVITEKVYCADHVRKMKRENAAPIPTRELVAA